MTIKMFAVAAMTLAFATSASAGGTQMTPVPDSGSSAATERLVDTLRLAQTATCIHNGKRYNKGARLCMGGVYHYCNSRGLWEPSNLTC